ncbi:hypothetical protein LCGC14_0451010 [marine sediment metagenome]|uniref:Uncharacterized protein n=1 Tax=marine sediment metagenome TaxID=412755 RepID=A0A0F9SHR1_9ZZZZ
MKKWTLPDWMKPYVCLLSNVQTEEDVERLMNNHTATVFENAPLALICVSLKSQVTLLNRLQDRGLLLLDSALEDHS